MVISLLKESRKGHSPSFELYQLLVVKVSIEREIDVDVECDG